jgi:hypothetical protein
MVDSRINERIIELQKILENAKAETSKATPNFEKIEEELVTALAIAKTAKMFQNESNREKAR